MSCKFSNTEVDQYMRKECAHKDMRRILCAGMDKDKKDCPVWRQ